MLYKGAEQEAGNVKRLIWSKGERKEKGKILIKLASVPNVRSNKS